MTIKTTVQDDDPRVIDTTEMPVPVEVLTSVGSMEKGFRTEALSLKNSTIDAMIYQGVGHPYWLLRIKVGDQEITEFIDLATFAEAWVDQAIARAANRQPVISTSLTIEDTD